MWWLWCLHALALALAPFTPCPCPCPCPCPRREIDHGGHGERGEGHKRVCRDHQ
ncbi:MAG: hypothetical protein AB7K09_08730 [Planctomycetota bacterium]